MTVFCFPAGTARLTIRDFFSLRENPAAQMSRSRRRAAALVAWRLLERRPLEAWPDFWNQVQADRG
jgi:hypothetical protein